MEFDEYMELQECSIKELYNIIDKGNMNIPYYLWEDLREILIEIIQNNKEEEKKIYD